MVHVVYLLIPTSNHNNIDVGSKKYQLYIFWFLHQTTTDRDTYTFLACCISFDSYIKPQRFYRQFIGRTSCISFDSYIKPQPRCRPWRARSVVYLLIPTSNHNLLLIHQVRKLVVYLLIPTSNHNYLVSIVVLQLLYIFWFLHQTTTSWHSALFSGGCISFDSYIKPQQGCVWNISCNGCISFDSYIKPQLKTAQQSRSLVVYLLIPTSNHNL